MAPGEYVLLVRNAVTGEWREVGAGDPKKLREDHGDEGIYVEVPTRSWTPYQREKNTVVQTRTLYDFPESAEEVAEAEKPNGEPEAE